MGTGCREQGPAHLELENTALLLIPNSHLLGMWSLLQRRRGGQLPGKACPAHPQEWQQYRAQGGSTGGMLPWGPAVLHSSTQKLEL